MSEFDDEMNADPTYHAFYQGDLDGEPTDDGICDYDPDYYSLRDVFDTP